MRNETGLNLGWVFLPVFCWVFRWVYPIKTWRFFGYLPGFLNPGLFLVSHFNLLFILCDRLSWLPINFLLHIKYTLSYHIVSCQSCHTQFNGFFRFSCQHGFSQVSCYLLCLHNEYTETNDKLKP